MCEATLTEAIVDDDGLQPFLTIRPRLFSVAYRILGSAAAAEDIVQDVWIRWQTTDRRLVRNPAAFLMTATTRLAINVLRSARARRETSVGDWLCEPVDLRADAAGTLERAEARRRAVTFLFRKLRRGERVAYLLREAFSCPYREIAGLLRVGEANARQLVTRARQRVRAGTTRASQCARASGHDDHEDRHHWRDGTHRLEARESLEGTRA
jgi:RNA polymerase sigma-70 factor (ECF subfamily)